MKAMAFFLVFALGLAVGAMGGVAVGQLDGQRAMIDRADQAEAAFNSCAAAYGELAQKLRSLRQR